MSIKQQFWGSGISKNRKAMEWDMVSGHSKEGEERKRTESLFLPPISQSVTGYVNFILFCKMEAMLRVRRSILLF